MIRIIRVLEYEFGNNDDVERHLSSCEVPLNGSRIFGSKLTIRSSGIIDLSPKKDDNDG